MIEKKRSCTIHTLIVHTHNTCCTKFSFIKSGYGWRHVVVVVCMVMCLVDDCNRTVDVVKDNDRRFCVGGWLKMQFAGIIKAVGWPLMMKYGPKLLHFGYLSTNDVIVYFVPMNLARKWVCNGICSVSPCA